MERLLVIFLPLFCKKRSKFFEKVAYFRHLSVPFFQYVMPDARGEAVSVLKINISKLPEGAHQRSFEATPEELGLDSRFTKSVLVESTLEKTSRQLYVRTEFKAAGMFTCDRCLEEFEREISSGFGVLYVTDPESAKSDDEDVQVIMPDTNIIDLGEDVRQYALLSLPVKNLCRDTCAGLCPSCGTNLNQASCKCGNDEVDTRWSGLQKIKN